METNKTETAETAIVHVKDHKGVRHYPMSQHADADLEPVEFLRRRAEGYFRAHCRTGFKASITVGGRLVARAWVRDTAPGYLANRLEIEAEPVG